MLSKTLMFVRVIVLLYPNIEWGDGDIKQKRKLSFWGIKMV